MHACLKSSLDAPLEAILGPSGPSKSLKTLCFFQCFLYFGCFPSKSHFEPLWGLSWGPLAALFSLKQGRLGAPRRSGAPTDYFFSALGGPKRPQRAPQTLSWTPRGPPRGPRGPRTPLFRAVLDPFYNHLWAPLGVMFSCSGNPQSFGKKAAK